jgi:hypothetical protein
MTRAARLAVAIACCASMWLYVDRVLVPYQRAEAALHATPRGNLSDLYPSWVAARELLLHRRDPYAADVTREIQAGYFGRALNASRSSDPTNQQAFAYPVYVVFLLAPVARLPFAEVQFIFRWLLALVTALSIPLWLRAMRWSVSCTSIATLIILTLGSFAAVQGIRLQQLTLMVAFFLAASMALLAANRQVGAGALLALAMIKPQLSAPLAAWALLWSASELRNRWKVAVSFVGILALLTIAGEIVLPGWIGRFFHAMVAYRKYAAGPSLLQQLGTSIGGSLVAFLVIGFVARDCWRSRMCPAENARLVRTVALVLCGTLLVIPVFAPHYQLLLLPAVFLVVQKLPGLWVSNRVSRILIAFAGFSLVWAWLAAGLLCSISLISPFRAERLWQLPLWTNLAFPITISACVMLVAVGQWRVIDAEHS